MTILEKQNLIKTLMEKRFPNDDFNLINARLLGQFQTMLNEEQLDYLIEYNTKSLENN